MCFKIIKNDMVAKIADQDIPCYKVLVLSTNGKTIQSPYRTSTKWKLNNAKESKMIRLRKNSFGGNVHEGLHSKKTYLGARKMAGGMRKIYNAYIPAGTVYWENRTEYCSEMLIVTDLHSKQSW